MRTSIWSVSLLLLSACGALHQADKPDATSGASASKYRFDYTATNNELISLVRVFDDGGTTYFQFRDSPPEGLVVSAETVTGEAVIPHERMGNYATIRGVYRQSGVPTATQPVVVRKLGEIPAMANIGPVVLPASADVAKREVPTEDIPPTASLAESTGAKSRVIKIRFAPNSGKLSASGRREIASFARESRETGAIEVRVRPFYPTRSSSKRLAKRRAEAIRLALTKAGVSDERVLIQPGGAAHPLVAEVSIGQKLDTHADKQATAQAEQKSPDVACRDTTEPRPINTTF